MSVSRAGASVCCATSLRWLAGLVAAMLVVASPAAAAHVTPDGPQRGGRPIIHIPYPTVLRAAPNGRPLRHGPRRIVDWGSFAVLSHRGNWLGISSYKRRDDKLAWVKRQPNWQMTWTRVLVIVRVSARRVTVITGGRVLMQAIVGIGAPSTPSPTGWTSVFTHIRPRVGSRYSPQVFGRMIIGLGLWQRHSSPLNPRGGAMAFHGTAQSGTIGQAASGGCFRMREASLMRLTDLAPPGTPVRVMA